MTDFYQCIYIHAAAIYAFLTSLLKPLHSDAIYVFLTSLLRRLWYISETWVYANQSI